MSQQCDWRKSDWSRDQGRHTYVQWSCRSCGQTCVESEPNTPSHCRDPEVLAEQKDRREYARLYEKYQGVAP